MQDRILPPKNNVPIPPNETEIKITIKFNLNGKQETSQTLRDIWEFLHVAFSNSKLEKKNNVKGTLALFLY